MNEQDARRYPIGKFKPQDVYTPGEIGQLIKRIETLPARLAEAAAGLSDAGLDTPYREGGWTARQVIHHVSDSHMNALVRLKWTLTEDSPLIKAYDEKSWALTPETKLPPDIALSLLHALHAKWVAILKALGPEDLAKSYQHPDTGKYVRIETMIALYAWHGDHHIGHIQLVANA